VLLLPPLYSERRCSCRCLPLTPSIIRGSHLFCSSCCCYCSLLQSYSNLRRNVFTHQHPPCRYWLARSNSSSKSLSSIYKYHQLDSPVSIPSRDGVVYNEANTATPLVHHHQLVPAASYYVGANDVVLSTEARACFRRLLPTRCYCTTLRSPTNERDSLQDEVNNT
jgi:hypothetical protein